MGRGQSKSGGGGGVSIETRTGETIHQNKKLVYGARDKALSDNLRGAIVAQEAKSANSEKEYAKAFNSDGSPVGDESGGRKSSVGLTSEQLNAYSLTHNHPRENGMLGGTFSTKDIDIFAHSGLTNMRASAKEGTYSITKVDGFDIRGLTKYYKREQKENRKDQNRQMKILGATVSNGDISWDEYDSSANNLFNQYVIKNHNALRKGQKQYGYIYTLERSERK